MGPGDRPDCAVVTACVLVRSAGKRKGLEGRRIHPFNVSIKRCESFSTSKILMVRSEEQVASRRP